MPELIRYFVFLTNLICPALGRFPLSTNAVIRVLPGGITRVDYS